MHTAKQLWVKPEVATIELARARSLITDAIRVLEDLGLGVQCTELRDILKIINEQAS